MRLNEFFLIESVSPDFIRKWKVSAVFKKTAEQQPQELSISIYSAPFNAKNGSPEMIRLMNEFESDAQAEFGAGGYIGRLDTKNFIEMIRSGTAWRWHGEDEVMYIDPVLKARFARSGKKAEVNTGIDSISAAQNIGSVDVSGDPKFSQILIAILQFVIPDEVILFGSRGRETNREDSDYDIAIQVSTQDYRRRSSLKHGIGELLRKIADVDFFINSASSKKSNALFRNFGKTDLTSKHKVLFKKREI
jgi:predicted nucleotidyltransferase